MSYAFQVEVVLEDEQLQNRLVKFIYHFIIIVSFWV